MIGFLLDDLLASAFLAKAPDHSVFSRFKDQLIQHKIHKQLFNELDRQLQDRGFIIKKETLVDVSCD